MKLFILSLLCLTFSAHLLAFESETDCSAMNENREKIIKNVDVKVIKKEKSTQK